MNNAPYFATILSTFLGSLKALLKFADVKPYTELIAVLSALAIDLHFFLSSSPSNPERISIIICEEPSLIISKYSIALL